MLTSVFAIVTTYAIFRYRLFNLKAAVIELLVFAWWLLVVLRALSGNSSLNFVADQALLAFSVPIGTLLLRSLHIQDRERK